MYIKWVMPSNHLTLCRPLLLLPSIFPSMRVFSNESVLCIRWSKYWSFNFSISPSNEYSFRIFWFDLFAVQGLSSLLQLYSFIESVLPHSAFFMVQLSHSHIALIIWTFFGKVISLIFLHYLGFITAFLPRSRSLLISWLQSPSAVILEPKKIKFVTVSTFSSSFGHEVMVPDAMIFTFEC